MGGLFEKSSGKWGTVGITCIFLSGNVDMDLSDGRDLNYLWVPNLPAFGEFYVETAAPICGTT